MQLFGARGCGSAIVECMLSLVGMPYTFVNVDGFDQPGFARDRLGDVSPLYQVPALVLEDGTVLTETAAIALYLSDRFGVLAPPRDTPERTRFYRLLVWLVANIYPTFSYGDYPGRWAPSAIDELESSTAQHREKLYNWLEHQVAEPFVLGTTVSALDLFLAVMVAWRPGPAWFRQNTPGIARIAERTRRLPLLACVVVENGWPFPSQNEFGIEPPQR